MRGDAPEFGARAANIATIGDVQAVGVVNPVRKIIEKLRALIANSLAGRADRTTTAISSCSKGMPVVQ